MANTLALGDYSSTPTKTVTPIQGITTELDKKNIDVNHLGVVSDDEPLFNIKSINLILKDGTKRKVDLSKAEKVSGMTLSNGTFTDVTTKAVAVISNVDFLDVVSVEAGNRRKKRRFVKYCIRKRRTYCGICFDRGNGKHFFIHGMYG